jgi:hypothetical protein
MEIVKDRPAKCVEIVDDEGATYLLVSDGPDTNTGRVLRRYNETQWTELAKGSADIVLLAFVAFKVEQASSGN